MPGRRAFDRLQLPFPWAEEPTVKLVPTAAAQLAISKGVFILSI